MKVGMALNMLSQPGRPDSAILNEHMQLGDLAEPLGFDSLFALEHHFTGYAMSPSPLQFLSYYAGRTKRITLGTGVIVIPWHDLGDWVWEYLPPPHSGRLLRAAPQHRVDGPGTTRIPPYAAELAHLIRRRVSCCIVR